MLTSKTNAHSLTPGDLIAFGQAAVTVVDNHRTGDRLVLTVHTASGYRFEMTARLNEPLNRIVGGRS